MPPVTRWAGASAHGFSRVFTGVHGLSWSGGSHCNSSQGSGTNRAIPRSDGVALRNSAQDRQSPYGTHPIGSDALARIKITGRREQFTGNCRPRLVAHYDNLLRRWRIRSALSAMYPPQTSISQQHCARFAPLWMSPPTGFPVLRLIRRHPTGHPPVGTPVDGCQPY